MPYLPIELQQHINEYAKPVTHPGWRYGSYSGHAMRNAPELLITSCHTRIRWGYNSFDDERLFNTIPNIMSGQVYHKELVALINWLFEDGRSERNPIEFVGLDSYDDPIINNDIEIDWAEQTPQYKATQILYNLILTTHIFTA